MKIIVIMVLIILICILFKYIFLFEKYADDSTSNVLVLNGPQNVVDYRMVFAENEPMTLTTNFTMATSITLEADDMGKEMNVDSYPIQKILVGSKYVTISPKQINSDLSVANNYTIDFTSNFLFQANFNYPTASLFIYKNTIRAFFSNTMQLQACINANSNGIYFQSITLADNNIITVEQKNIKPDFVPFVPLPDILTQTPKLISPDVISYPMRKFGIWPDQLKHRNQTKYFQSTYAVDFSQNIAVIVAYAVPYNYAPIEIGSMTNLGLLISPEKNANVYYAVDSNLNFTTVDSFYNGVKISQSICYAPDEYSTCASTLVLLKFPFGDDTYIQYALGFIDQTNTILYACFPDDGDLKNYNIVFLPKEKIDPNLIDLTVINFYFI